jgi:alanine racemase
METKGMNRRAFLAFAGVAPLGLAAAGCVGKNGPSDNVRNDFFDPWLEINTKNLAWNVSQVRRRVENRPIMAVIKCNAYGHGLVGTAKALQEQAINKFAVVKVQEGIDLRENGIQGMILNFGPFSRPEAEHIVRHGISQSVFSHTVETLAEAARRLNIQARVHVKVDTGLGRVGVPYDQALSFIEKVASMPDLAIEGIFTTLTEEEDFDKVQVERLIRVCEDARKKGISVGLRHAASSLAVANYPGSFLDMVRPGNCLYGLEPLPHLDLKPSISLKTRIIYVKKMRPGQTVAYHQHYKIKRDTLMATLPLGYSDGYPSVAVDKADVLIKGRRWPMVAYMSANHVFVDITGGRGIQIGDEVVLFGSQDKAEIIIGEVAEWGDSSVYKVPILMNPLLPRIYV